MADDLALREEGVVTVAGERLSHAAEVTLFGTSDPVVVIEKASAVASALKSVMQSQGLITKIGNRDHPQVEAWTLAGSMLGVFPVTVWTRQVKDDDGKPLGWEARVEARTRDGGVVGGAEAECLRSEKEWGPNPSKGKPRDDYALRSMAQTRATSKALRMPLGFVMVLAGYAATPAEEMTKDDNGAPTPTPQPPLVPPHVRVLIDALDAADRKGIPAWSHHAVLVEMNRRREAANLPKAESLRDLAPAEVAGILEGLKKAQEQFDLEAEQAAEELPIDADEYVEPVTHDHEQTEPGDDETDIREEDV